MNTVQAKESEDVFDNQRAPEVIKVTLGVFSLWICAGISAYNRSSEGQVSFFFSGNPFSNLNSFLLFVYDLQSGRERKVSLEKFVEGTKLEKALRRKCVLVFFLYFCFYEFCIVFNLRQKNKEFKKIKI